MLRNTGITLVVPACNISGPWDPPSGWTGPDPVVYRSFDCPDGLMMMEGNKTANLTFVTGEVLSMIGKLFSRNLSFFLYN